MQSVESELVMTSSELEKQRALNEKLENDLLQMEAHNPKPTTGEPSSEDTDALAGLELGKKTVRHSLSRGSIATLNVCECEQASPARSSPIPFASSADTSILPIVTSQRDRFRQRNAELEEVRRALSSSPCLHCAPCSHTVSPGTPEAVQHHI